MPVYSSVAARRSHLSSSLNVYWNAATISQTDDLSGSVHDMSPYGVMSMWWSILMTSRASETCGFATRFRPAVSSTIARESS